MNVCARRSNYMLAPPHALVTTPPHMQYLQPTTLSSHPTVLAFVEYLRRERIPRGRPGLLRNVLSHPLPVSLVSCDVTLLILDLIGRQEAHHILLLLFDLCTVEMNKDRGEAVSRARANAQSYNMEAIFLSLLIIQE